MQEHSDSNYNEIKENNFNLTASLNSRDTDPGLEYRSRESIGSEFRKHSALKEEEKKDQVSGNLLSHHSAMSGTTDSSQRSSSPLKRRASDLENDASSSPKNLEMVSVPSSSPPRSENESVQLSQIKHSKSSEKLLKIVSNEAINSSVNERQQTKSPDISGNVKPDVNIQIKTIESIIKAESERRLEEGDKAYLLSNKWLSRFKDQGTALHKSKKTEIFSGIGSIDNSDIIQQTIKDVSGNDFVQLKTGLGSSDFTLVPESAWELLVEWFGIMPGTIPIIRTAHNTNPHGEPNIIFEYYPLILKIHRLFSAANTKIASQRPVASSSSAPILILSRSTKWVNFLKVAKSQTGINMNKKVRVWRVRRLPPTNGSIDLVANKTTPPSSRPASPTGIIASAPLESQDSWVNMFLDASNFLELDMPLTRELIDAEDVSIDPKYNGSRDLSMVGLGEDQTIVLEENSGINNTWISNNISKDNKKSSTMTSRIVASLNTQNGIGFKNSANSGAMMTRGRTQKLGRALGTVGLTNLGNTCYMNSALQCIRAVEELTKYFLAGAAMEELNSANPLGNNGDVAMAYQKLLEEIYHKENVPSSITPRHFRNTIGRYAPSFSGYGQQDTQEFLGFLLDGLQEDLSRVKKKPYIEKPDSTDDMINNPDAIRQMADKVWDITKKRDDSIIADLFTGMYKSTLVCPECEKVSITFDPFNNLTLQLPIESIWSHNIFYFPLNERPFIMTIEIDKQASIQMLKQYVSLRVGVPVEKLFIAEEFKCRFYKFYRDYETASEVIQNTDHVAMYELDNSPTNWPPPSRLKKKSTSMHESNELYEVPNWDDPISSCMIVPVIHRRPNTGNCQRTPRRENRKAWVIDCAPHMITLTSDEAQSEDAIRRKILEKVATFTTSTEFEENIVDATSIKDTSDMNMSIITESDDIIPGEGKVKNHIEEQTDITMRSHAPDSEPSNFENVIQIQPKISLVSRESDALFKSKTTRPKWIKSSSQLKPEFQNMFEIGYCKGTKELIPSGWNIVDEDKMYPSISSRSHHQSQVLNGEMIENDDSDSRITSSETSDDDSTNFSGASRLNEDSDSDNGPIFNNVSQALPVRSAGSKSTIGKVIPKTRKNRHRIPNKKIRPNSSDLMKSFENSQDEGPLIRLGEMIIVDWNPQAFDTYFSGDGTDKRAQATWDKMPSHKDDALAEKRKSRLQRKKNGITLDDCLDEFGKEETLSEMDTWYCPRCKEHRRANKKFELWKTPDILIMHLKRFSSSARRRDKLDVRVDFPIEGLDLSSRVIMQNKEKGEIYDLIAVDNHWGGLGGGHYTAHARNFCNGEWYEYNDSSVSKLKTLSDMVSSSAYLLFYRRRSSIPLGGPKLQQIIEEYDNKISRSEDEAYEAGEDQALVGNSSLHGSSSALTGAGAVHHRLISGSSGAEFTVATSVYDQLPPYRSHEENDEDSEILPSSNVNRVLQKSIEDEGYADDSEIPYGKFSMHLNSNNFSGGFTGGNWDFSGLDGDQGNIRAGSGSGSDDELSSERVQCDSCPSQTSNDDLYKDFEDLRNDDKTSSADDVLSITDTDEEISAATDDKLIHRRVSFSDPQFCTGNNEALGVEELTTDIRLEDLEEANLENDVKKT
ncbi:putative ubiquitin carboxyl-terminal hydrolase usp19 [Erysiphe neolycopersici]|uniref:ubiquitinyl hydrolase 1 n=1 Tax=Erysiphe neolycopersici TaxID=212602 RepID=A0A420I580_9PEZI|nr:putative ubiquitin carboxyl-terminal hydrolase usp19 [Erysiphe neolycopersici]